MSTLTKGQVEEAIKLADCLANKQELGEWSNPLRAAAREWLEMRENSGTLHDISHLVGEVKYLRTQLAESQNAHHFWKDQTTIRENRLVEVEKQLAEERERLLKFVDSPAGDLYVTRQKLETANRCCDELQQQLLKSESERERLRDALKVAATYLHRESGHKQMVKAALEQSTPSPLLATVKQMATVLGRISTFYENKDLCAVDILEDVESDLYEALSAAKKENLI